MLLKRVRELAEYAGLKEIRYGDVTEQFRNGRWVAVKKPVFIFKGAQPFFPMQNDTEYYDFIARRSPLIRGIYVERHGPSHDALNAMMYGRFEDEPMPPLATILRNRDMRRTNELTAEEVRVQAERRAVPWREFEDRYSPPQETYEPPLNRCSRSNITPRVRWGISWADVRDDDGNLIPESIQGIPVLSKHHANWLKMLYETDAQAFVIKRQLALDASEAQKQVQVAETGSERS